MYLSCGVSYPTFQRKREMVLLTNKPRVSWPSFLFLIYRFFLLSMNSQTAGAVRRFSNETDRLALLSFKNHLSNDPYDGALASWNDTTHFCEWHGITCSSRHHQRVTALDLHGLTLVGTIAPHIANLTFLRVLNLRNNSIHGKIPKEIGRLFRLQYLHLELNSIVREIPTNLTACSKLIAIYLRGNKLEGELPVELGLLSKLQNLSVSDNNLTGSIPPSFGNLSSLIMLHMVQNSLQGSIPCELGQLPRLERLVLSENKLSGSIPSSIYNISTLKHLQAAFNNLNGSLPPHMGLALPNLALLFMARNQLSGPIPISLSNASYLQVINLPNNYFTESVPKSLGGLQYLTDLNLWGNELTSNRADGLKFLFSLSNCTVLENLDLSSNRFQGTLPDNMANLSTHLTRLRFAGNKLSGSIPMGIENLLNLTLLDLDSNFLTGFIPSEIGKLKKLQGLFLHQNMLTGEIPSSIGNLTQLTLLNLHGNRLWGMIPSSLANCKQLLALDLSQNHLSGTVPKQIGNISTLSIVANLSHNALSGLLPLEMGNLQNLVGMDISENKLLGTIPSTLGNCLNLKFLYMVGNSFVGPIPQSMSGLFMMQWLDFSRNNLSGKIPKNLEKLPSLQYLNLSFNHLEGEVPKGGVFSDVSAFSIHGNDKVCGGIAKLHLPLCPIKVSKEQGKPLPLRVIIPAVSIPFFLIVLSCFFATLYCKRKLSKKPPAPFFLDEQYKRFSYAELVKATDGFSPANLMGVGSFSSVYKGILENGETVVAVKVLDLQQRGASKSFMVECKALRKIRHRNLVKIITSCSSVDFRGNDFKALVFEFMSNGSLEKWLHQEINGQQQQLSKLNLIQRLDIAIDVAFALDYLHNHCETPTVHCDLKPSNVLLDDDMCAHVGDFGLARFLSPSATSAGHQSSTMGLKGSIGYIAPEYGMDGEATSHGDVYSYGILVLEMFTGKRPVDDMFKDGLDLHKFVRMAFPEGVVDVVDPILLEDDETSSNCNSNTRGATQKSKTKECLVSILRIALSCSVDAPRERMDMKNVVIEMHDVRGSLLRD